MSEFLLLTSILHIVHTKITKKKKKTFLKLFTDYDNQKSEFLIAVRRFHYNVINLTTYNLDTFLETEVFFVQ